MKRHAVTLAVHPDPAEVRRFRAECACGWVGPWSTTNACMGRGRRHATMANKAAAS